MAKQSEEKRAEKLRGILAKLADGQHVQNRQLERWLGDEAFQSFLDMWKSQKELREYYKEIPAEVIEYRERLHKLKFIYSKADVLSNRRKSKSAEKLFHECDAGAEKLLEFLNEKIQTDPALAQWFDRNPDDTEVRLEPNHLPHPITSRSINNMSAPFGLMSKNEVKIYVVECEISAIENSKSEDLIPAACELRRFIHKKKQSIF